MTSLSHSRYKGGMQVSAPYPVKLTFGPDQRVVEVGQVVRLSPEGGFRFDCGACVESIEVAYQTYGTLNADKSNAVLLCHGLTGDQYLAGKHPVTGKDGWWADLAGRGKIFDTDRYFLICTNVMGGCLGSLGPKSVNPLTGAVYGMDFPVITIADMVRAQVALIDAFGIPQLLAVIGGSMGGMMALEWAAHHPTRLFACAPIATAARHSAQNIAFHEIGRQAIMADPEWAGGQYLARGTFPAKGLAVARMTAHVTYLSEMGLQEKFGRRLQNKRTPSPPPQAGEVGRGKESMTSFPPPSPPAGGGSETSPPRFRPAYSYGFEVDFQVESYLRHQGASFIERFDPNSYLYITRAMDYFDLEADAGGILSNLFRDCPVRFCLAAFSSDWLFPPAESRHIVRALNAVAANVSYTEIDTDKGHDAFLLDVPAFHRTLKGFLDGAAVARGVV